jgi:large subunit ribosomal protein L25
VEEGGILMQELTTVQVKALPDNLPGHLEVDTSNMEATSPLLVEQIPVPDKMEIMTPGDHVVATITLPSPVEEEVTEEITEPVLVGEEAEAEGAEGGEAAEG